MLVVTEYNLEHVSLTGRHWL